MATFVGGHTTASLQSGRKADPSMDERVALIALLRGAYATRPAALRQLIIEGEMPSAVLDQRDTADAESLILAWTSAGNSLITFLDSGYPVQMREVHDFPLVLFARGQLVQDDFGICVVGSREAGDLAERAAGEVASLLVEAEMTVVSGLAKGIDAAAHTAALAKGGRTVGVLGTGVDRYTPASSRPIQQQLEKSGLVISQFWPGFTGNKAAFPMRNAVMSAYGRATIILAASEKSGTRHQARQALAHGRPLILSQGVASQTTWGRAYAENAANEVAVVKSASEAVEMAIKLARREPLRLLVG